MQVRIRWFLLYRKSSIRLPSLISPQYTGEQNKYPPPPFLLGLSFFSLIIPHIKINKW